jgi:KaiC/GvpD/RAD55 family RecA-like ATPase
MGLLKELSKKQIKENLSRKKIIKQEITKQRKPFKKIAEKINEKKLVPAGWFKTGISGLDRLLKEGIPLGTSILIAGGAGSGKTILSLQALNNVASNGKKGLYISLEESEFRLKKHMQSFGWNPEMLEKKDTLMIKRVDPFKIARSVEALLAKAKGELNMKLGYLDELIPKDFKPDFVVIDSLTALSAAFKDNEVTYRIYIEQLFRYLETINVTSFLISETEQIPVTYSKTGVEEFLADGVIVIYNIKHGNIREGAIEILKLRGAFHQKKIVALQITEKGIMVYPEQEVFEGLDKDEN